YSGAYWKNSAVNSASANAMTAGPVPRAWPGGAVSRVMQAVPNSPAMTREWAARRAWTFGAMAGSRTATRPAGGARPGGGAGEREVAARESGAAGEVPAAGDE